MVGSLPDDHPDKVPGAAGRRQRDEQRSEAGRHQVGQVVSPGRGPAEAAVPLAPVADHGVEGVHGTVRRGTGCPEQRRPHQRSDHGVDGVLGYRLDHGPDDLALVEGRRITPDQRGEDLASQVDAPLRQRSLDFGGTTIEAAAAERHGHDRHREDTVGDDADASRPRPQQDDRGDRHEEADAEVALPVVSVYNNDLTGYIPTNIISITDGQIFFDKDLFLKGQRPAINTSISISRIGKRVQDKYIQDLSDDLNLALVKYTQSEKFSHFGTNLSNSVLEDIYMGEKIENLFRQSIGQVFSLFEQRVLLTLLLYYDLPNLHAGDIEYIQKRVKEINYIENFTKDNLDESLVRFLIPQNKDKNE